MSTKTYSRADILQKFHAHCQSLAANDNAGYRREFEELDDTGQGFSYRAGELDANKEKNRYPFILPYDHCRVKLSLLEAQPHSDYINASFVPGGCSEQDFICTQAPLRSTMADFWRMVWEQNVHVIVMLTALSEHGKTLCNQYWPPERGTGCYGAVQVTTTSCQRGPDYYITTLRLRQHGCPTERRVTHYLYPGWPDRSVPKDPITLCAFTEHIRKHLDNASRLQPAVVHCSSAGVGRSGSFVALLWLMQLCVRGISPEVRLAVEDLRKRRVMMVQNLEQYILVHQCLFHWLGGDVFKPNIKNAQGQPHISQSQRTRQSKRERRIQSRPPNTHQPEHKSSNQTAHANSPQQRGWRAIQTTLQTFSPSNLLRRIMPTSSQHTQQDSVQTQL